MSGYAWHKAHDVPHNVPISYYHVSVSELHEKEREIMGSASKDTLAFAHLQQDTRTGKYFCTVYLGPGLGSTQQAIEHEKKHCRGWNHQ